MSYKDYCYKCHKKIYRSRDKALKALNALRKKSEYTGNIYKCPYSKGLFHLGRRFNSKVKEREYDR